MIARRGVVLVAVAAALLAGVVVVAKAEPPRQAAPGDIEAARQDFAVVYQVLLHPRCRNCHPVGDRPLQGEAGVPHRMNISRKSVEAGLPCATCHRDRNAPGAGMPPGAPHWGLPPRETPMVFEGRAPRELCLQLKDPEATGGRDLAALVEHVHHDSLVLWGWSPGPGRAVPPVSHAAFAAAFTRWAAAGGPCPEP